MSHIHVISPIVSSGPDDDLVSAFITAACPTTQVSHSFVAVGPSSVECMYEDAVAVPGIVQRALEAEQAGADAIIINCMNDPGLEAARSVVSIPVIGAAQAAYMVAGMLADRFSIVGTDRRDRHPNEVLVRRYGLKDKYASTRWVSIPVLELKDHREELAAAVVEQAEAAVLEDGAQAVIFGCTLMADVRDEVQRRLLERGIDIPIPDPVVAAMKWAETILALGLCQSRQAYPLFAGDRGLVSAPDPGHTIQTHPGTLRRSHRLTVVVPVTAGGRNPDWLDPTRAGYGGAARPEDTVEVAAIEAGPSELLTPYQVAMATPEILRLARQAERGGSNAVILDCMGDPGIEAAREALDIPVVGPMQASAFLTASLARRVSIIGTELRTLDMLRDSFLSSGLVDKLASVRGIGLSPEEIALDRERACREIVRQARLAILEDEAQAIIPGCTDMIGMARAVAEALQGEGLDVPVIEPPAAAVAVAEALCDMDLSHSKLTWPRPPHKVLPGYPDLEFA